MPEDPDDRLNQIRVDLAYFKKAQATMGGGQPPTLYAEKYVLDIEYLLKFVPVAQTAKPVAVPKTDVEVALEHDEAGRVERKLRRS
jgi:hypothetical protein